MWMRLHAPPTKCPSRVSPGKVSPGISASATAVLIRPVAQALVLLLEPAHARFRAWL